jgi:hypothetical protein
VQIHVFAVALNYQGKESPIFYNEAKFKINGNCGYLLKPEYMRQSSSFDLETTNPTWYETRQDNLIATFVQPSNPPQEAKTIEIENNQRAAHSET